jgi:multidrug resistance efflux pump
MMQKLLLPAFWVIALIGAFILSDSLTGKSLHFFGIAGEREQSINFQYPVEVVQFFVVEGKKVAQGDEIAEVKRPQLDSDLISLDQEIRRLQLEKQESIVSINSQLANLKAKKQANLADMDYQIHTLQLRLKINADMLSSISGKSGKQAITDSAELNDLKRKRHFSVQAIQVEIDHLSEQLKLTKRPVDAHINGLLNRKEELHRQNIVLKVKAKFDGRIGSVNFKAGELVSPYQSIMSVHSGIPRYIKGYIHENIVNDVEVGQTVWVKSIALKNDKNQLSGIVESLGNRIVEYPVRLKKNPLVPAWGREVVIRLNNLNNSLLFGEKVQVLLENTNQDLQGIDVIKSANASVKEPVDRLPVKTISSRNPKISAEKIEASGILWNPKDSHYLLISDEKYKGQAGVFIMEDGMISERLIMQDKDEHGIDDLESISFEGDYTYILSSLSHNKKDKLKAKRKKLIRFKYQNKKVTEQQELDLYKILIAIKNAQTTNAKLVHFLTKAIDNHSLDIESHFVKNNNLYLGFKSPFTRHKKTLIVKISNLDAVFGEQIPDAEIWQTITLSDPDTGEPMRLSDMIMVDDQLLLLSGSRSIVKKSVLWRYQLRDKSLKHIQQFPGISAEGISYRPKISMLTVVFDEGKKSYSKYLKIPFASSSH